MTFSAPTTPRTSLYNLATHTTPPDPLTMNSIGRTQSHDQLPSPPGLRSPIGMVARSRTGDSTAITMPNGGIVKAVRPSHAALIALNDTPDTTAPSSPAILPRRQNSGDRVTSGRVRPTTLDIPGLTKSSVSPDGRIAQRDIGAKLVIVMVGLPARGKSYITKKLARYLNWLQHDTRIFNVGERRRVVAGGSKSPQNSFKDQTNGTHENNEASLDRPALAARLLLNGEPVYQTSPESKTPQNSTQVPELYLPEPLKENQVAATESQDSAGNEGDQGEADAAGMDQSAAFFDPDNEKAAHIREQCAMDTLDELLHYILHQGGSVGILDATNSTLERRKKLMARIREVAGPHLNVLFCESLCVDDALLERNMMLKLSGPDYKDKDQAQSLQDFKKRVEMYMRSYVPLGEYEEKNGMPFVQMIDVGRKVISHQIKGFLSAQAVYYLLNFNLAPRQIWITRHGESADNVSGKLGGDAPLTEAGKRYARALTKFLSRERKIWEIKELQKAQQASNSMLPGSSTPPNPHYTADLENHIVEKNFCVWTSMLRRSIETAQYFDEEEFDIKQMRMLNELNAGNYEGLTYEQIKKWHRDEFNARRQDKLEYRYPGPGGEGYLDVVNRLRPVIVELERMTDHCLLIGHRSVARILLAYFKGLDRSMVPDLDVPLGILWCLEPKPYGVSLKAYRYDPARETFELVPDYELKRANLHIDDITSE